MHVTTNQLGTAAGNSVTSISTSSVSPASNALLLAHVSNRTSGVGTPVVTGNGLTWVLHSTQAYNGPNSIAYVFRALGSSPSSGVVTADWSATALQCRLVVDEFIDVDTSGTNGSGAIVQAVTANGTGSPMSATLAAFSDANNATYGCWGTNGAGKVYTAGTGFAITAEAGGNNEGIAEWRDDNDTSVDMTHDGGDNWGGIAIEIKFAAAASGNPWYHYAQQ